MNRKTLVMSLVFFAVFALGLLAGRMTFSAAAADSPTESAESAKVIYTNSSDGAKLYMWDFRGEPSITAYYDSGVAVKSKFTVSEISRQGK